MKGSGSLSAESKKRASFGVKELILAGLLFAAAYLSFTNPVSTLLTFSFLFGMIAIFKGSVVIYEYFGIKKATGESSPLFLAIGIVDILIGLIFILNFGVGAAALSLIFAVWFIVDSVEGLLKSWDFKGRSNCKPVFWSGIFLNGVGLMIGILLLLNPWLLLFSLAFLIGCYFLLYFLMFLFHAFL